MPETIEKTSETIKLCQNNLRQVAHLRSVDLNQIDLNYVILLYLHKYQIIWSDVMWFYGTFEKIQLILSDLIERQIVKYLSIYLSIYIHTYNYCDSKTKLSDHTGPLNTISANMAVQENHACGVCDRSTVAPHISPLTATYITRWTSCTDMGEFFRRRSFK